MTAYSAGLALQAVGVRIRRSLSVIVDGVVAVSLTLYALLVSNFLDTVSNVLQLTVVLLGPSTAVYATDILLRRGRRYDGLALTNETPGSPFWYTAGVSWAGALALAAGVVAAALCVNTLYTGPLADALGGVDLALPVGIVVASATYAVLMRSPGARMSRRTALRTEGHSPHQRGHDRGHQARDGTARSWCVYDKFFQVLVLAEA